MLKWLLLYVLLLALLAEQAESDLSYELMFGEELSAPSLRLINDSL